MKRTIVVNGNEDSIELISPAPDCRFRFGGAAERLAQVEVPEPGVYSILVDGRVYEARVEDVPAGAGLIVVIDGHRFEIELRDPRRRPGKSGRAGAGGSQNVAAPMPGKVVRVLVSPGQQVQPGQGLVVVEAMKMQNEMKALRAGTVLSVAAKEGATVTAGEILAVIGEGG